MRCDVLIENEYFSQAREVRDKYPFLASVLETEIWRESIECGTTAARHSAPTSSRDSLRDAPTHILRDGNWSDQDHSPVSPRAGAKSGCAASDAVD